MYRTPRPGKLLYKKHRVKKFGIEPVAVLVDCLLGASVQVPTHDTQATGTQVHCWFDCCLQLPNVSSTHFFLLLKSPPFNESPPVRTAEYSSLIAAVRRRLAAPSLPVVPGAPIECSFRGVPFLPYYAMLCRLLGLQCWFFFAGHNLSPTHDILQLVWCAE